MSERKNIYYKGRGFEPFFDADSRVLILGSFPSVKSRESGFYYGNKQNRFYKVLSALFGEEIKNDAACKKDFLKRHRIALYDMAEECETEGSSDGKISRYKTADISGILRVAHIEKILLNGKKAHEIFIAAYPDTACVVMPSTSPANPSFRYEKWFEELRFLLD
ncbi:MAG: DNA-deoxyinosine glycosylase [Clostridiales bacterium]|jgi:hypoxanthine-DNA glycosylase|nr:DNA-deoxyinosine glycosylase [Clostridiales bacterium]